MAMMNPHSHTRIPAVAGSFYPGNLTELDTAVQSYLDETKTRLYPDQPLAIIVPHAGYIYSAPIAASGYAQLVPFARKISRVVLLGPSHRVPFQGIASSSCQYFQTPLGDIPLDREAIDQLNHLPFVKEYELAHSQEHSLEVQLPFLQKILPQFKLIPLVIGQADDHQVEAVIEHLWHKQDTLFLLSSDLSHYLDYNTARQSDQATCHSIEELNPQTIHYEQACGRSAIAGMLLSAKKHNLQVKTLDLRNSGDTAGSKDRVVGYGCWMFSEQCG